MVPADYLLSLNCRRASHAAFIDDVAGWMCSNRLQLNSSKTEVLWLATSRRLHQLPRTPLRFSADFVASPTVVRNFGILIDSDVSMRSHVTRSLSTCFSIQYNSPFSVQIRDPVVAYASLILSRLDYGNATLEVIPQHLLRRLQSVMNVAA